MGLGMCMVRSYFWLKLTVRINQSVAQEVAAHKLVALLESVEPIDSRS